MPFLFGESMLIQVTKFNKNVSAPALLMAPCLIQRHADLLEEERQLNPLPMSQFPSGHEQLPVEDAHAQRQVPLMARELLKPEAETIPFTQVNIQNMDFQNYLVQRNYT
jgi:hypothetical protein